MLIATALVLLMTPALGLFYAGPRALEEHAQHVHDVHRRDRGRDRHLGAGRLLARLRAATATSSAASTTPSSTASPSSRATARRSRTSLFFAFQATLLHHHRRRWSRAPWSSGCASAPFLVFAALWSVLVYAVLAHWAFGGGWLHRGRHARLRRRRPGRDGLGLLGARGGAGGRRAQGLRAPGAAARTTRSTCCSAPACSGSAGSASTAAAASRPANSSVLAFTNTLLTPACTLLVWFAARPDPRPAGDGDRRRDGDHRRLRRDHPGGRLHQPRLGDGARRARRAAQLRGDRLAAAHPGRRDARRARRPRRRGLHRDPLHRLLRPGLLERRLRRACSTATPTSSATRRWPRSPRRSTRSS